MSKLMENKHMIHVLSEIAAMLGITFYFSKQNKKLKGYIEDVAQRMEEQEDLIQRHEEMLKVLAARVGGMPPQQPMRNSDPSADQQMQMQMQMQQQMRQMQQQQEPRVDVPRLSKPKRSLVKNRTRPSATDAVMVITDGKPDNPTRSSGRQKVSFNPAPPEPVQLRQPVYEEYEEDSPDSESDMDAELEEELGELTETDDDDSDDETDLKKQPQ